MVGKGCEERARPQPSLGDDVNLGREHDDQREQIDPRDQTEHEAEHAVCLGGSPQPVRDEVGADDLHDLPADAGDDGADAQVTGRYLGGSEHAEGDYEEPDVRERGKWDRSDAKPGAKVAPKASAAVASPASVVVTRTPAPSTSSNSTLRRRRAIGFGRSLRGTATLG